MPGMLSGAREDTKRIVLEYDNPSKKRHPNDDSVDQAFDIPPNHFSAMMGLMLPPLSSSREQWRIELNLTTNSFHSDILFPHIGSAFTYGHYRPHHRSPAQQPPALGIS